MPLFIRRLFQIPIAGSPAVSTTTITVMPLAIDMVCVITVAQVPA